MSDDDELMKLRQQKAQELMEALDTDDTDTAEPLLDILPWSFRHNMATGYTEMLQHENVVAVAVDPEFASMVTEMLNRGFLWQEAGFAAQGEPLELFPGAGGEEE